ncbi:sensor histidine kinase [Azotosporobacter soli]|uniref:sensor histidine kinase n=1 Tax=Azotosporobacter soli TaxID=3055040 RepID=UPI0031FEEF85
MKWFREKSLYGQLMLSAALLSTATLVLGLIAAWEALRALDALESQRLFGQMLLAGTALWLLADRLAVWIAKPFHALARQFRVQGQNAHTESEALRESLQRATHALQEAEAERQRLLAAVANKEEVKNTLLKQLIQIQEEERRRISRELHDETGQALTTLLVTMRVLAESLQEEQQRNIVSSARDLAMDTLHGIRDLAVDLRPPAIDDLGLAAAMNRHLSRFRELHGLAVDFRVQGGQDPITGHIALALYRIVQEALTNILKHAAARSVEIRLQIHANHVLLTIADDGKGFAPMLQERAVQENRLGLFGMMERTKLLGGSFQIESAPEAGTLLRVIVPNWKEESAT